MHALSPADRSHAAAPSLYSRSLAVLLALATLVGSPHRAAAATTSATGSNAAINNLQPSLVLTWMICTQGEFPTRDGSSTSGEPIIGEIRLFALDPNADDFAGWKKCDGSTLPVTGNQALFSVLGPTYGGNGSSTFALPDLRGRIPVGTSNQLPLGTVLGTETMTLVTQNLPQHAHSVGNGTTSVAGSSQAFSTHQPSLALNFSIVSDGNLYWSALGWVRIFAFSYAPSGHVACNGQILLSADPEYAQLASVLGQSYGDQGAGTFAVPDFSGRTPVGAGQGTGLTNRAFAISFGSEEVTLSVSELPSHTHTVGITTTSATGGSGAHTNVQPSLALNATIMPYGLLGESSDEPATGEVRFWARAVPENANWLACDGAQLQVDFLQQLFSVIGTTFGGNQTQFAVPDLRGRAVVGAGTGSGLSSRSVGQSLGAESVTLTTAQMPAHTHTTLNAAPVLRLSATQTLTLSEDASAHDLASYLDAVDTDSGQTLTWSVTVAPTRGSISPATRTASTAGNSTAIFPAAISYTPSANESGSDTFTVQVSDGQEADTLVFNVTINAANDAPTDITDTNAAADAVAENASTGATIGITAQSTDIDGDTLTYSLTDDANGRFTIGSSSGIVTVADATLLNYESATSHSITVQVTDGAAPKTATFSIAVTNAAPSTPSDANAAANEIAEGSANGTAVGVTASATDPHGGTVTYSLSDDAGGRFAIDSSTGIVTLADTSLISHAGATSHTITVRAADAANAASTQSFTIAVLAPPNVAPVAGLGTALRLEAENAEGVSVPHASSLDVGIGSFTIEAWFKRTATGDHLVAGKTDLQSGTGWTLDFSNNRLVFRTIEISDTVIASNVRDTVAISDSNWHHVAAVRDSATKSLHLYVDGALRRSGVVETIANVSNPGTFGIGDIPNYGLPFEGSIDDVRLWNVARTESQIGEYMHAPLTGAETGLIGYWDFEDGTGTIVGDRSGHGHHGTLAGGNGDEWTAGNVTHVVSVPEQTAVTFRLGGTDTDDPATTTAVITALPQNGTLTQADNTAISAPGVALTDATGNPRRITYTPGSTHRGTDSLTYKVNDGSTDSANTVTITLTTYEVNDAPVATDDALSDIAAGSGARTIPSAALLANDSTGADEESAQTLTITGVANPTGGTVSLSGQNVVFTPTNGFIGSASFDYTVRDNGQTNGVNDFKADTGTVTFAITDTTAPDTTLTNGPATLSNATNATFEFSATDSGSGVAAFEASLDGGGFATATSPLTFTNLSEEPHTLQVRAIDHAGNVDPTPASYTWTIDASPPAAPVITTPANGASITSTQPTISGTAESNSTITVVLDGSSAGTTGTDGAGNWSLTPASSLALGSHTAKATATDAAGNTSPDSNTNTFTIASNDANLSNLTLSTGSLNPVFASGTVSYTASVPTTTASLTVTPTAAHAGATVKVNNAGVTSGSPSSAVSLDVGTNTITILVTAQDSTTTKTYTIAVTRAAPVADLDVTIAQTPNPATGATNTYLVTVANHGPDAVTGALYLTFAGNQIYNSPTLPAGWSVSPFLTDDTHLLLGQDNGQAIASGASVEFTLTTSPTSTARGARLELSAVVMHANSDPDQTNNTVTLHSLVGPSFTPDAATALANVTAGTRVTGDLDVPGQVDAYSFSAHAGDRVYAATATTASSDATNASRDTVLRLVSADGRTVIEIDDDDGGLSSTSSSIAGATIPADGTYYLLVDCLRPEAIVFPYDLYVRVQSGTPAAETDASSTGQTLPASGWVSGDIADNDETDTYVISLAAGDTLFASLDLDPTRNSTSWNAQLTIVPVGGGADQAFAMNGSDQNNVTPPFSEAMMLTVKDAGDYLIEIRSADGSTGSYQLSASVLAAPAEATSTFTATIANGAIPDGATLTSTVVVPSGVSIGRLKVALQLDHANVTALDVHLTSPRGNTIGLIRDVGSYGNRQLDAIFDDTAAYALGFDQQDNDTPLFTTRGAIFKPGRNYRLDWLAGQDAAGTWTLTVRDRYLDTGTGTLQGWSLIVVEPEPAPDGVRIEHFSTGFETNDSGFTHSGTADAWAYGTPSAAPIGSANSGTKAWKTSLAGNYASTSNQDLVSPNIDLTGVPSGRAIELSWAMSYQLADASTTSAFISVEEVGDGNQTQLAWRWLGPTMRDTEVGADSLTIEEAAGWAVHRANISDFAGKTIRLRFHLETLDADELAGLAIDDVSVNSYRPRSSNADLSALTLTGASLVETFASDQTAYTANVAFATSSITATASTTDTNATLQWSLGDGDFTSLASGGTTAALPLEIGSNIVRFRVTAEDGTEKTYSIAVTRAAASADLALTLTDSPDPVNPTRNLSYTLTLANDGPDVATNVVLSFGLPSGTTFVSAEQTSGPLFSVTTPAVGGSGTISGSCASFASGASATFTIVINVDAASVGTLVATASTSAVTDDPNAANSSATATTTVAFANNADLSALAVSSGTLSPAFAPTTTSYAVSVPHATTSLTVTPTVADSTATVKVNGTAVTSGSASGPITLNVGANTVSVVATAQDGTTTKTYTVIVTRAPSTNSALASLTLSTGILSPSFAPSTTDYTASVEFSTASITVTPTTAHAGATIKVNTTPVTSGSASAPISLSPGNNRIEIVVVAQDGITSTTYQAQIVRAPGYHSADTDQNWRLSLLELTRVIELYNARDGTVRTGAYHDDAESEDGFAPGDGTLTGHHSADTNQDGKLSLLELTRVIELYNARDGTVRTGAYHRTDEPSEDGFAPGVGIQ